MNTEKTQNKDPDLLTLESSLIAVEDDPKTNTQIKYGPHPRWIYYYISFLFLMLVLAILAIINFLPHPEAPMFLSLHNPEVIQPATPMASEAPTTEATVAAPAEQPVTNEQKQSSAVTNPISFIPEQLRKQINQLKDDTSIELAPVKAEAYSFLGWYENNQKFKQDGLSFAVKYQETDKESFRSKRDMAFAQFALGQYEKTKAFLTTAKKADRDSLTDWMDAMVSMESKKEADAVAKLEQIVAVDQNFYPAAYVLIKQYIKQNQMIQANTLASRWRTKGVSNLAFAHLIGQILERQQQYVDLVFYFSSLEGTYPNDWTILFSLGKSQMKLQKSELAMGYFQKIIASQDLYSPDQMSKTYFEMGKQQLTDGKMEASIQSLQSAVLKSPEDVNIKYYLANAFFKHENYEKAIEVYQQILNREKHDPKIRIYLGMAYFESGQFQIAEKNFVVALNQGLNEPLLYYYLAKTEENKGNLVKTREYLQRVLAIDPKHALATKMLEKLKSTAVPAEVTPVQ